MRSLVLIVGVASGSLLISGCGKSVRGLEGDVEARIKAGTLTATMDRGIDRVYQAVQKTIGDLGLTTIMSEQDGVVAEILLRDAQGEAINIRLQAISPSRTSLMMRAGMQGDANKSRVIFRGIQDRLRAT